MNYWIDHCEPPRTRPDTIDWDVFISYRSLDRVWALALYDMLVQCGYRVFLDQFVLVPGKGLASQLGKNLNRSASGVLVWSKRTADSKWVENELDAMVARRNDTADSEVPFYFVVASLDGEKPPGLQSGQLYLDFSEYPDGPMGADLVRLTCGLQGEPLSPESVKEVAAYEKAIKEEPARLRAMAKAELYDEIAKRAASSEPAYTTSATLAGVAVDLLIRGKRYADALSAARLALSRFPSSVRIQQLQGLAMRRMGQLTDAALNLNLLVEKGHRDTETLGILAAVWADLWEERLQRGNAQGARDALERSRDLYREGFEKVPTDTYTGINAASKSALLGELKTARELADKVLARLEETRQERGGEPSSDYWERVTEPEALLVRGEYARALELYHDARVAHQNEAGSIESTGRQAQRLLGVLDPPDDVRQALAAEFGL